MAGTPSPSPSSVYPPADFGSRFSAFVIDAVLLFTAQWTVFIVLSRQLQAVGLSSREPCEADPLRMCEGPSSALWVLLLLVLIASTIGYYAFFEGRYGATPGKRWMGLRVVSLAGTEPMGFAAAGLRAVIRQSFWLSLFFVFDASPLGLSLPAILFILLPAVALALVAYAAVAPDGRGAHDLAAGTQVVREDQVPRKVATPELNEQDAAPGETPELNEQDAAPGETSEENAEESV